MSFAKSFYADQKKVEQPQQAASPITASAIPATTPIAEDPLTPAQIQEAIRIYRSVLSNSAPSSPVRAPAPPVQERPQVHSNYYGGGPTDIPQSYLLNYSTARGQQTPVSAPVTQVPEQHFTEQQLIAQLQALQLQQQQQQEPTYAAPPPPVQQQKVTPKRAPVLQKMYDDEESGYCFARVKQEDNEVADEVPEAHVATPTSAPQANYSAPQANYSAPQVNYSPAPVSNNYSRGVSGPSEYIGMSNDSKFIYDAQKALPAYNQNNTYTLVNATPVAPVMIHRQEESDDQGMTTTEDVTQVPASPAVLSRFRGLIRNAQTPTKSVAPIVVERIAEPPVHQQVTPSHNYNNYGAFQPINQMSMESEYQLPVLNDLASCIEHY
ncbi:hypothetical protein GCK72_004909 [Caenorhabditis remanei]|nr:hypothetical protein GCK72_004909 [Caenorhabditis remanei]KAF1764958.1 hypothetical protein GCK72_004909 [Caenorhabditis remanei]